MTVLPVVVDFSYRKFIAIIVGFAGLAVRPLASLCSGSDSSCWQVFTLLLAIDPPLNRVNVFGFKLLCKGFFPNRQSGPGIH